MVEAPTDVMAPPTELTETEPSSSSSSEQFYLFHAKTGKSRLVGSFNSLLESKLDNTPPDDYQTLHDDAEQTYQTVTELIDNVKSIRDQLRNLGLHRNITIKGQNSDLIKAIIKSDSFGQLTGKEKPQSETSNLNASINITSDGTTITLPDDHSPLNTSQLESTIHNLTSNEQLQNNQNKYTEDPDHLEVINWSANQAVIRELLPKNPIPPIRSYDLSKMELIEHIDRTHSTSETFQASNPLSVYKDPQTGRKYMVKRCPTPTLQADHFGLQVLEMHGVPTYEYGLATDPDGKVSLVSGFLDGYHDPADIIDFPNDTPHEVKKTILPDWLESSRSLQRGLLAEILIGEYNTKAHNIMVLGEQSFVHLDQGGSLNSTASGKYKSFGPETTIQDVQDVLHCYTDWDPDQQEHVNAAYGQIAEVVDNQLVIKDIPFAKQLLEQENRIPLQTYYDALEQAGYQDGQASIDDLRYRIHRINDELLPKYRAMPDSARKAQYLRWLEGARQDFYTAIDMGGELSYYKHALAGRRESLLNIWESAIEQAESGDKSSKPDFEFRGWEDITRSERTLIHDKWWAAWNEVIQNNNDTVNVAASAALFVESITHPESFPNDPTLNQTFRRAPKDLSAEEKASLIKNITEKVKRVEIPLSSPHALHVVERITDLGDTRIWTTGDVKGNESHTLPDDIIGSDELPGSGQQVWKLALAGVGDLRRKVGKDQLGIEAHDDKFGELPRILDEFVAKGRKHLYIIDDSHSSLVKAEEILHDRHHDVDIHYILVNQGRKRALRIPELNLRSPKDHYHVIDHFDEAPNIVNNTPQDESAVLCDFDGVVTNNTSVQEKQADQAMQLVLEAMNKPLDKGWQEIRELTEDHFTYESALPRIQEYREQGYTIVLTNGVFDLIHPGHVDYLEQAQNLGGNKVLLVVGLNSDASVKANKGDSRPINQQLSRAQTLIGTSAVGEVIIFDDKTADDLIRQVKPDVYVKGGDYTLDDNPQDNKTPLPESETLSELGIRAEFIQFLPGHSTTSIINQIVG